MKNFFSKNFFRAALAMGLMCCFGGMMDAQTTLTGGTWNGQGITGTTNVIINGNVTSGCCDYTFSCANLTINSTRRFDLAEGCNLTVNGTFTNNGTLYFAGLLILNGPFINNGTITPSTDWRNEILRLNSGSSVSGNLVQATELILNGGSAELSAAFTIRNAGNKQVTLNGGTLKTFANINYASGAAGRINMTSASTIDLGNIGHTLTFASINGLSGTNVLTIKGWQNGGGSGTTATASTSGGKIIISGTTGDVANVYFEDDSGTQRIQAYRKSDGEIVPKTDFVTCTTPATKSLSASPSSVCPGSTTTVSVTNPETGVTYALYDGTTQIGSSIKYTGSNTVEWTPTVIAATTYTLKVVEADNFCAVANMATTNVTLSILAPVITTTMPVCRGDLNADLTIVNATGCYWQTSANGTSTANPAFTGKFVREDISGDDSGTTFYLRRFDGNCWSEAAEVTVFNGYDKEVETCEEQNIPIVTIIRNSKYFTDNASTGIITCSTILTDNGKWIEISIGGGLYMYQNFGTNRYLYYGGEALTGGGDWWSTPAKTTATPPASTPANGYKWGKATNASYIVLLNNSTTWTAGNPGGSIFLSGGYGGWTADVPVFGLNSGDGAVKNNVNTWLNGITSGTATGIVCSTTNEVMDCPELLPNLTITDVEYSPTTCLKKGDEVTFSVSVKNDGLKDVPAGNVVATLDFDNGQSVQSSSNLNTLAIDSTVVLTITWTVGSDLSYSYTITVDKDDLIEESIENDNTTPLDDLYANTVDAGTVSPAEQTIAEGTSAATITLSGGDSGSGNIQWQYSTNGIDFSDILGEESATFSAGTLSRSIATDFYYRAAVTVGACTVYSDTAHVAVREFIVIKVKKPSAWSDLYMHWWADGVSGTWANDIYLSEDNNCSGWYTCTIPDITAQNVGVLFGNIKAEGNDWNGIQNIFSQNQNIETGKRYLIGDVCTSGCTQTNRRYIDDVTSTYPEYDATGITINARFPKDNTDGWNWDYTLSSVLYIKVVNDLCGDGDYVQMSPLCVKNGEIWFKYTVPQTFLSFIISPVFDGGLQVWDRTYQYNDATGDLILSFTEESGTPRGFNETTLPEDCVSTSIEPLQLTQDVTIYTHNSQIFVVGIENFTVYNITSKEVQNRNLLSGVYIVKIGNKAYKAIVK